MTAPAFSTSTVAIASSTGITAQVKVALLAGGVAVVAHAFVDSSGATVDPAKDTTVQAGTASILAATALLTSQS